MIEYTQMRHVVMSLSKLFPHIEFDVDEEYFGGDNFKFAVWVGDLNFYLEQGTKFKKICKGFHKKYPNLKWYAYYSRLKKK